MAVTLESVGTVYHEYGAGTTNPIPHPSGLTVGDLMVVCSVSTSDTMSATGWTEEVADSNATSVFYSHIFYKVADSADVAAGSTTFVRETNQSYSSVMLRVSGFDPAFTNFVNGEADSGATTTTTHTLAAGLTPVASSLLIMCWSDETASGGVTASGYAIATDNPTWTERVDDHAHPTANIGLHIATALRTQATATGNVSVTYSGNSYAICLMFAISPPPDVTVTNTPLILTSTIPDATVTGTANVTNTPLILTGTLAEETITTVDSAWTNDSKNTSTWTNDSKS